MNEQLPSVVSALQTQTVVQDILLSALAARLNVLASLKRILNLPSSANLQKRKGIISSALCITARNEDGSTALHLAVAAGLRKVTLELLRFPAIDKLVEEESSSGATATADDGPQARLLADCAAHGGNMELVRLFLRRTKDSRLRLLCAGLVPIGGPFPVVAQESEEREGGGGSGGRESARPLLVTFKDQCALRGAFTCPSGQQSYFEVEIVSAGDTVSLSMGFATDKWGGCAIEEDDTAWGVAGRTWKDGDVVGLGVDRDRALAFVYVNGKQRDEGTSLPEGLLHAAELRPAITGRSSAVRVDWVGSVPYGFKSVWSQAQQAH